MYNWRRTWEAPLKRLHQDAVLVYQDGQRRCWERFGVLVVREYIVQFVDGWAFVRGPEMDDAARARMDELIDHVTTFEDRGRHWWDEELRPKCVALGDALKNHPEPTRPLAELLDHLEDCFEGHAELMGDLHWQLAAGSIARGAGGGQPTYSWPSRYAELTGRPEMEASLIIAGSDNEMSKTVDAIRALARMAAEDADLLKAVSAGDILAVDHVEFMKGFRSLLERYGYRTGTGWGSAANNFETDTWNVTPEIPLQMIATYARSDLDAIDNKERLATAERELILREVRDELSGERLKEFEDAYASAAYDSYILEDHNDVIDQTAAGVLRDAEHIVGLRLVADGVIEDPRDVAHLSIAELRSVPVNARELIAARKDEIAEQTANPPAEHIGEAPPAGPSYSDEGEGHVGNELRGVASSPGRYTGRARVFTPSPIPPDVDDGDILVAKDAGPDWTPVFAVLGAIVLDVGAIWQHAAVVAREFGIPAVTGTKDGTTVIKDGQTITVDGNAGIVEL